MKVRDVRLGGLGAASLAVTWWVARLPGRMCCNLTNTFWKIAVMAPCPALILFFSVLRLKVNSNFWSQGFQAEPLFDTTVSSKWRREVRTEVIQWKSRFKAFLCQPGASIQLLRFLAPVHDVLWQCSSFLCYLKARFHQSHKLGRQVWHILYRLWVIIAIELGQYHTASIHPVCFRAISSLLLSR